jgi:hypothetical protein
LRLIPLTVLTLAAGGAILPGEAGGQEAEVTKAGFPVLFAPYVGFHAHGPPSEVHEAVGLHLLYDLAPRVTVGARAASEMGKEFGKKTSTGADLLWRFRSSPESISRACLGIGHWEETTALTVGLRSGGGFSDVMEEEASSGGILPPLMVWFEVRGGVARVGSERGTFYRGVGIAEISMVLLLRKAE